MAKILLIDDDELLRRVLSKALEYAGHTIIQAADGQQGIELARATGVELVITDLVMPVREGVETILQLRRERPALPIIAISGDHSNSKLYLEIAAKIGAKRILSKPFAPAELLKLVDSVLASGDPSGAQSPG
jgi:DNA-binding response OmpR family regulator